MDKQDVIQALELSALAYKQQQPYFPNTSLSIIDDCPTGVQCYLRRQNGVLSIAFRGSNSAKDWQHNLAFWKKCHPLRQHLLQNPRTQRFLAAYKDPHVRGRIPPLYHQRHPHRTYYGAFAGGRYGGIVRGGFGIQLPPPRLRSISVRLPAGGQQSVPNLV